MLVRRDPDGAICLDRLTPLYAETLLRLPEWLALDEDAVRRRLFPDVYEDPEEQAHWQRYGAPELEALFATRQALVSKDLESLEQAGSRHYRLWIAKSHEQAWLQSLNAARLTLFARHGLSASDMELDPAEATDEDKEIALVRIHVMAHVQEALLQT